jgi:hypothetical protein
MYDSFINSDPPSHRVTNIAPPFSLPLDEHSESVTFCMVMSISRNDVDENKDGADDALVIVLNWQPDTFNTGILSSFPLDEVSCI